MGSRRRRAVRHARRHGRESRVPGRRRVRVRGHVHRAATTRGSRTSTSRSTASASRSCGTRRARPAAADGRGAVPMKTEPIHRQGRAAPDGCRVRAPVRRSVRRSDSAARLVVRRRRIGRHGHHDAAASARPDHSRAVQARPASPRRESRQRIFTLPADRRRPKSSRARARSSRVSASKRTGVRSRAREVDGILQFYDIGAAKGGFEAGVRSALEAILASPYFIFRIEKQPENVKPGATYRVSDIDLASRLSFFLWGTPPDKELLAAAARGRARRRPPGSRRQTRRMLADPRARGARHALRRPVAAAAGHRQGPSRSELLPELRRAARRRDAQRDRDVLQQSRAAKTSSVLDLYRADYTFVNERLARHYGFPGVAGDEFRKVQYPGRHAPRPARPGQRARADVARQPHVGRCCAASG